MDDLFVHGKIVDHVLFQQLIRWYNMASSVVTLQYCSIRYLSIITVNNKDNHRAIKT